MKEQNNNDLERVLHSFKWKKSSQKCANKLGLSLEEYLRLKEIILSNRKYIKSLSNDGYITTGLNELDILITNESRSESHNLDSGESKFEMTIDSYPKTAEEIIALLNLDTSKYKLSQYWNKQVGDKWKISALVTKIKTDDLYLDALNETLKTFKPSYDPIKTKDIHINRIKLPVCAVLSTQDLHFGKKGNESIDTDFEETIKSLAGRMYESYNIEKLVYVIGGDLINMDTFSGTTTGGTPVDNNSSAYDIYPKIFNTLYWSIKYLKQFCDTLHVIYIPGNHDRLSSFHLAHALEQAIPDKDVIWDTTYLERKVIVYGDNLFCFEHGDVNTKLSFYMYATEFAKQWGQTKFRTLYIGHMHTKRVTEYVTEDEQVGFTIKRLPSLSSSDYWHYHNKFTGSKRGAIVCLHHLTQGLIDEMSRYI